MAFLLRMAILAGLAAVPGIAVAQGSGSISVELNKVADANGACRTTFVAQNGAGQDLDKLSLDVVVFDSKGEVNQRLLLDLGRMPKDKTKVVEFDLPSTNCSKISRVLLNQVQDCTPHGGGATGFCDHVTTSSRVPKLPFDN